MNKKYLISGYGPSKGGVGRLVNKLQSEAEKRGYKSIIKSNGKSAKLLLSQKRYLTLFFEIVRRTIDSLIFDAKCRLVRNAIVIFIHPQKTGFVNLFTLAKRNTIFLYVVDNSFFCIRSYNTDPIKNFECLKCLGKIAEPLNGCYPFPVKMSRRKNIRYLTQFRNIAKDIIFMAQNSNQKKLLEKHFGKTIKTSIVGLDTGEIENIDIITQSSIKSHKEFILFHGSPKLAKGVLYFVNIARELPEYTFVIPSVKEEVENVLCEKMKDKNIVYKPCTWESGLKELVITAKLVLNPSQWSAPIEGALLKSIFYNGNVATATTKYSYEEELKNIKGILRLNSNIGIAANQIRDFMKNRYSIDFFENDKDERFKTIQENVKTEKVFDLIESLSINK